MADSVFYLEVPASMDDSEPYRFFFSSEAERDRFADALDGYRDDYGYSMCAAEHERLYSTADEAVIRVKELMGWSDLPEASDPD